MDIIQRIIKLLDAHVASGGVACTPTVYVGRIQVQELRDIHAAAFTRPCGEFKQPAVLGMPLIQVVEEDYLRVA